MKKRQLLFMFLLGILSIPTISFSQCAPFHTSHDADQSVLGPCFTFATVAALESIVGDQVDLSEWYLYSKCVQGGLVSSGTSMLENIVEHANTVGLLNEEDFFNPFNNNAGIEGCLNESNNANTPCIFICESNGEDFDFCDAESSCPTGMEVVPEGEHVCSYNDVFFGITSPVSYFEFDVTIEDLAIDGLTKLEKQDIINGRICQNQGVILFLDNYRPDNNTDTRTGHGIFVYGKSKTGSKYTYKDSWPGDADANRSQVLDLDNATHAFVITGNGSETTCGPEVNCDCELTGPSTITGATTFSLVGDCFGKKSWNISDNLSAVAGGTSKSKYITVVPSGESCSVETANISAMIKDCPPMELEVTLDPDPVQPSDILIFAQDICPGDLVEINVIDDSGVYPSTSYNWSVAGGSIVSGQGSPVIFVQVSNISQGTLNISVTAENACGESEALSISVPFSNDCDSGGGGQYKGSQSMEITGFNKLKISPNPAYDQIRIDTDLKIEKYTILDVTNSKILESSNSTVDISRLDKGVYFIRALTKDGKSEIAKFIKL